ncbi:MAG TPA: hypothetical protein VII58_11290, partial [Acidobacteriaceae bacterium]
PGERVPAVPGKEVRYRNGTLVENAEAPSQKPAPVRQNRAAAAARERGFVPAVAARVPVEPMPAAPTLF